MRRPLLLLAWLAAGGLAAQEEEAEKPPAPPAPPATGMALYESDDLAVHADFKAGGAFITLDQANFGTGVLSRRTGRPIIDPQWAEAYGKPIVTLESGNFYGGTALVWAGTVGSGDATNVPTDGQLGTQLSNGDAGHVDLEQLYAGWRSGPDAGRTKDGIDISAGRQDFVVGDGFLINDGNLDAERERGFYVAPRSAWNESVILRSALLPLRGDVFYLKSDKLTGESRIYGVNVEWIDPDLGTVGAGYMRTQARSTGNDRNAQWVDTRNNMHVFDLRGQGNPLAALPDLFLSAEYTYENSGERAPNSILADGWYAEAGYKFSTLPWTPTLSYRYAHFSGDNANTDHNESFDSLFYAASATRGWGTWYMGEITGLYMLFNSNENVHMLHLKTAPSDMVSVGGIFYVFSYDQSNSVEKATGGTGVKSAAFGKELDIYSDWTISGQWSASVVAAHFFPDAGGIEAYGNSRGSNLLEMMVSFQW